MTNFLFASVLSVCFFTPGIFPDASNWQVLCLSKYITTERAESLNEPYQLLGKALKCSIDGKDPKEKEYLPLHVKHLWQEQSKGGWKIESWTDGSRSPPWYPVPIWIRATPDDQKQITIPKAEFHFKVVLTTDKKQFRESKAKADWQLCSTMKKRREMVYDKKKKDFGDLLIFPPENRCWEVVTKDPFQSDRRLKDSTSFVPGDYELSITVTIEGGPDFVFPPQIIKIEK